MLINDAFEERFTRGQGAECWIWERGTSNGYGVFWYEGKTYAAHRFSYELYSGQQIPEGMLVCHTCDVRHCVNPAHLFLGTHADNSRDMALKGRVPSRVLTQEQVSEIRGLSAAGLSNPQIAARFGVSRVTVWGITTGANRKHG